MAPSHKRQSVDPRAPANPDAVVKKTERSHEENQERAYIAASRRQDRSIEARVQSARMASEIHKKRTGKAFRITEDIVRKEEMYEEEEDDMPRSFRMLSTHMQTDSPEFNARIEAWMTNRMAMSQYLQQANDEWNDNHINRLFAQSFPHAGQQAAQMTAQMNIGGPQAGYQSQNQMPQSPASHVASPLSPSFPQQHADRNGSISAVSHTNPLSPGSLAHDSSAPTTPGPRYQPVAPQQPGEQQSAFTSELPAEMKLMMGLPDMSTPQQNNVYSQNWSNMDGDYYDNMASGDHDAMNKFNVDANTNMFDESNMDPMWNTAPVAPGDEPQWDSFLNGEMWSSQD